MHHDRAALICCVYDARMKITRGLSALLLGLLAIVSITAPAQAAPKSGITTVTVYHQPVVPTAVMGSGIGTVRYFAMPTAVNGVAADGQYMTGTLTTLDIGVPGGKEIRASNLNFVFGSADDQLIIGGIAIYPAAGATLADGTRVVRPVIGGSGKYAGAAGQAISTNLGDKGWTHVFKIRIPS
jgi:hypothetical protein